MRVEPIDFNLFILVFDYDTYWLTLPISLFEKTMEKTKIKILEVICNVHEESNGSKLDDTLFVKLHFELSVLSAYFGVSPKQAFLVANIFVLSHQKESVSMNDLVVYFNCKPTKLLLMCDNFTELYAKRILLKRASMKNFSITLRRNQFILNELITDAIIHYMPILELIKLKFGNVVDLLEWINQLEKFRNDYELSARELLDRTNELLKSNQQFSLIRKIQEHNLSSADTCFFLQIIWKTITGFEKSWLGFPAGSFFETTADWVNYVQAIIHEENGLVKKKLIEIEKADFFIDLKMKLTDYSLNLLKEEGITI